MTNRIALAAGSAAAAITLAVALAAAGFAPKPNVAADPASLTTSTDATASPVAAPTVLVDTIYVAPPAEQQTITVTDGNGGEAEHDGEHDGEHESVDDD